MSNLVVQQLEAQLPVRMEEFEQASSSKNINFTAEAGFALQLLSSNSYLGGIAQRNPNSLRAAIINVAAIGTTLNPAEKKAFLVPRGGAVCLDISYRGLADIAVTSGAAEWVDVKLVYANDEYQSGGMGELPHHKPANPFNGGAGELIGVYAVAKRKDGSFAVREMSMEQVNAIKARSESGKKGNGPWKTDFLEMVRKTPVKAVVKMLQGTNSRIDSAIQMLNQQGEGIDFASEKKANPRDLNCDSGAQSAINALLQQCGLQLNQIPMQMITSNHIESVADLTQLEAGQLIAMLKMKLNTMNKAQ